MKLRTGIIAGILVAGFAAAGTIHVWGTGEYITASDLNAVLAHIHNNMVGGHGARLVNSDISSAAAITHTKLATPALLPKLWAQVLVPPDGGTPAFGDIQGFTTVTRLTGGNNATYQLAFPARSGASYAVLVTPVAPPAPIAYSANGDCGMLADAGTGSFRVGCTTSEYSFNVLLMDKEN
jgi:hypothetical protein